MQADSSAADTAGVSFRDSRWPTSWLLVGLGMVACVRMPGLLGFTLSPTHVIATIAILAAPHAFFALFPLLTRRPRAPVSVPPARRWFCELGVALSILIGMMALLAVLDVMLGSYSPRPALQELNERIAQLQNPALIAFLLLTVCVAPISEEIFFRGFLQNAFRARMHWLLAALAQSLIFGFGHTFGTVHALAACLVGMLFTLVYEWRKTLITPIFVHAGFNAINAVVVVAMAMANANSPVLGVGGDPNDHRCVIRQVMPGSPAEQAGLELEDVILAFDNRKIHDFHELSETVGHYRPGDAVTLSIERSGSQLDIDVTLQSRRNVQ